jgi:hypothetical protein
VYPERNPWRMRKDFFALPEGDDVALLSFLKKWGVWGSDFSHGMPLAAYHHHLYRPEEFWRFRDWLRTRSILPAKTWLESACRLPAWNSAEHPVYVLTQKTIRAALEDTITLEKMKQTEHAVCDRPGCGNIIAKTGKRPKKFCAESCALKVRQRRFWEARRRPKAYL